MGILETILSRKNGSSFEDENSSDLHVVHSEVEYDASRNKMHYMIFEIIRKDVSGNTYHMFKALRFLRLIRIPKNQQIYFRLMEKHSEILTALWQNEIHFVTLIANILESDPFPIGLLFSYGVQGVAYTIEEAKLECDKAYASLADAIKGTYKTMEFRTFNHEETEWLRKKMMEMDNVSMFRGIPAPHTNVVNTSMVNMDRMGGSISKDMIENETMEEFVIGMSDYEYIYMTLCTPISTSTLGNWLKLSSREATDWRKIMNNTHSINFNASVPLAFGGNIGSNQGWGEAHSVTDSTGHGTSHTSTDGVSDGYTSGSSTGGSHSVSNGESEGTSDTTGQTTGTTHTDSSGTSRGQSNTYTDSKTDTHSTGVTNTTGSTHGSTVTKGTSTNTSTGSGLSEGSNSSVNNSSSIGTSNSNSHGTSTSDSKSEGSSSSDTVGGSAGVKFLGIANASANYSHGWSDTESTSHGTGTSDTNSSGTSTSDSSGTSEGSSSTSSSNQSRGSGSSYSNASSNSVSNSKANMVSDSVALGNSHAKGFSKTSTDSVSDATSLSDSVSKGVSKGTSNSVSDGTNFTNSFSNSKTNTHSVANGTSESYSKSLGQTQNISNAITQASSGSIGLMQGLSIGRGYNWIDTNVENVVKMIIFQNERITKALNGQGAFYVDSYIATKSIIADSSARSTGRSAFLYKDAYVQPFQAVSPDAFEQQKLLYHMQAFSPCLDLEGIQGQCEGYKWSTMLLPDELASMTHPCRVSEGGLYADVEDMPRLAVPSDRQLGDVYVGTVLSAERYSEVLGYLTRFKFCLDSIELMHAIFQGESRSGKTVSAMRVVTGFSNIKRPSGKRLRILIFDQKKDWRNLAKTVDAKRFKFYTICEENELTLRVNPCIVPPNVYPEKWINIIAENFTLHYKMNIKGTQIITKALFEVYEKAGCFTDNWIDEATENSRQVNLEMIHDCVLKHMEEKRAQKVGFNELDAYERVLQRLADFKNSYSISYKVFNKGIGIHEMLGDDDITDIEANGLKKEVKNFIFGIFFCGIYEYGVNNGTFMSKEQYETIIVVEEANSVLVGQNGGGMDGGGGEDQSIFETIIDQSAGNGMYCFAVTQTLMKMPTSLRTNAGINFFGRTRDDKSIQWMVTSLGRNPRYEDIGLANWFARMPDLHFVVRSSRTDDFKKAEPVNVLVDMLPLPREKISDSELLSMRYKREASDSVS